MSFESLPTHSREKLSHSRPAWPRRILSATNLAALITAVSALVPSTEVFAAACCGGGVSLPALIQGDERAQVGVTLIHQDLQVDYVDPEGVWHNTGVPAQVETLRLESAWLLTDRGHLGVNVPVVRRTRLNERHSGLGDVAVSCGYEILPDWDYNPWRPKGVTYLQLVLPTGLSRAESERGGLDSRGQGFWALGLGGVLTKSWGAWDALAGLEVHRSLPKEIKTRSLEGRLLPGWGAQAQAGGGYNHGNLRFGGSISWQHEDGIDLEGPTPSLGRRERSATASATLSYLTPSGLSYNLSALSQTLIGAPENTSLASGISLQIQKRWAR